MELTHNMAFIKANLRLIAIFAASGLTLAVIYLAVAPKTYQARWQLQMAQFVTNTNTNTNIEEPESLVQRLRNPSNYSAEVMQSCGYVDKNNPDYLGGLLEVRVVKGVATSVDMKVKGGSVKQAQQCAEGVVAMIAQSQNNLIKERLAGRQEQLTQYQQALNNEQQQLASITSVELSRVAYLAKLDQLSWLRTRIDALQEEAFLSLKHPAKLTAPIYVANQPISPKPFLIMLMGCFLGLTLGILFVLLRNNLGKSS